MCMHVYIYIHMSASDNSAAIFIDKAGLAFLRDPLVIYRGIPKIPRPHFFVRQFLDALIS